MAMQIFYTWMLVANLHIERNNMKAVFKSFIDNDIRFLVIEAKSYSAENGWQCDVINTNTGEHEFRRVKNYDSVPECEFELTLNGKIIYERKVVPCE